MTDFPQHLTAAIKDSGLTLQHLSAELRSLGTPVSTATLSYWSTGRSVPARKGSRKAVAHLETLLGLTPGQLISTLPGQVDQPWKPTAGLDYSPALREALTSMELDLGLHLAAQLVREHVALDADRTRLVHEDVSLVRALDRVVDRFAVLAITPGPQAELLSARASHGCRVAEVRVVDGGVAVLDVRAERALHAGDLLQPRITVEWGTNGSPLHRFCQRMPQPVARRSLVVSFAGTPPRTIQTEMTRLDGTVTRRQLLPGSQVMDAMLDAPAGMNVVTWDDEPSA